MKYEKNKEIVFCIGIKNNSLCYICYILTFNRYYVNRFQLKNLSDIFKYYNYL